MSFGVRYCNVCDYEAENGYDLDAHIWFEHDESAESDSGTEDKLSGKFLCNIRAECFETKKSLMLHKKGK